VTATLKLHTVPLSQSLRLGQRYTHAALRDSLWDIKGTTATISFVLLHLERGNQPGQRQDTHRSGLSQTVTQVGTERDSGEIRP
jgi:hypothetical protein